MFQVIWVVPAMVVILYIFSSIKILSEYERGVVFRLGRVLPLPRGPALLLCLHRLIAWSGCPSGLRQWKCPPKT
jgi:hypothetical protein